RDVDRVGKTIEAIKEGNEGVEVCAPVLPNCTGATAGRRLRTGRLRAGPYASPRLPRAHHRRRVHAVPPDRAEPRTWTLRPSRLRGGCRERQAGAHPANR
ncbi:hypothetical protein AB0F20_38905, partial [Streptomyces goshikiensis]